MLEELHRSQMPTSTARDESAGKVEPLTLYDFEVRSDGGRRTSVGAKLGDADGYQTISFEIDADDGPVEVDTADGLFPIALLVAMQRHRPLHVVAPLSPRLLYHANHYLGAILARIHTPSQAIPVTASDLRTPAPRPGRGVCTGCSGGVDSFNVLQDHLFQPNVPGHRLTHLLFNSVGSHFPLDCTGVFQRRLARIRRLASIVGLPLVVTTSNQDELLGTDFMQFESLRNATVPLLLQTVAHRFYHAAAVTLDDLGIYPHDAVDIADPLLLSLLSTERMDLVSAGAEMDRIQKLARLPEIPFTHEFLDICTYSPAHVANCGRCLNKCAPNLFTMGMLGIVDEYAHLFDMEAYREGWPTFVVNMLRDDHSMLMLQIQREVRRRKVRLPASLRAVAWADRHLKLRERLPVEFGRKICRALVPPARRPIRP